MFIATARIPKEHFDRDPVVRAKIDAMQRHLENLAQEGGLDPQFNVVRVITESEVRIGISEDMELFLREVPGTAAYH
ncbi:MAG: hypothetical protein V3573_08685 [Desulfovibrionaceae bacterium]